MFSQAKYIFGISIDRHHYPWETVADVFKNLKHTDGNELAVSLSCIALLIGMKVWRKRNPVPKKGQPKDPMWKQAIRMMCSMSALVVVVIYTPLSGILNLYDVKLNVVGSQPSGIPSPTAPNFSVMFQSTVVLSAITISLIAFMESYAVAVSTQPAEAVSQGKGVDANTDLVALGLSNAVGSFFNSYPIAGSFGRTAVSARSGAKSTMSGAITAIFVIIVLCAMMPAFEYLPYCALASIIEVAVFNLIDIKGMRQAWQVSRSEFAVTMSTFVAVLALGIELGVLLGAGLSICFVLRRAASPNMATLGKVHKTVPHFGGTWRDTTRFKDTTRPADTIVMRVDAAIFFANCGAVQKRCLQILGEVEDVSRSANIKNGNGAKDVVDDDDSKSDERPAVPLATAADNASASSSSSLDSSSQPPISRFIVHISNVDYIDLSGLHMLHHLDEIFRSRNIVLGLSGPNGHVRDTLKRATSHHLFDEHKDEIAPLNERIYMTIDEACADLTKVIVRRKASKAAHAVSTKIDDDAIDLELANVDI